MKTHSVSIAIIVSVFILAFSYLKINRYEYTVNVPDMGVSQVTVIDKLRDRAVVYIVGHGKWKKFKIEKKKGG